jgi:hypothetical protein
VQVDNLGELIGYGEFWQFTYTDCGHVTYFPRDRSIAGGYDPTWLIRDIREHHANFWECTHPLPEPGPPSPPDPYWFVQDVHADRHPVERCRPHAPPAELHPVVVEGVFPHLVRLRLPSWDDDTVLYVERKTLPREVDAKLLEAGYRFAVEADLKTVTADELVASFWNWTLVGSPRSDPGAPGDRPSAR